MPKKLRLVYDQDWTKSEFVSALKCACTLFENNPLFNYAKYLLNAFVPFLQRSNSSEVRLIIFNCLRSVYASDVTGEATLMVCLAVCAFILLLLVRFVKRYIELLEMQNTEFGQIWRRL